MLDNLCNIKLADFGFIATDGLVVDKHNTYMGTRGYMAPELPRVRSKQQQYYDGRKVDVFALGLTLLNLITGKTIVKDARPDSRDRFYRFIVEEEYFKFWDFMEKMLYGESQERKVDNKEEKYDW